MKQCFGKIDLHRHLETSHRFEDVFELSRQHKLPVLSLLTEEQIKQLFRLPQKPLYWNQWYQHLLLLRNAYHSLECVKELSKRVICDAGKERIDHLELRFSLLSMTSAGLDSNFPIPTDFFSRAHKIIEKIIEGAAATKGPVPSCVRLICSLSIGNKYSNMLGHLPDLLIPHVSCIAGLDLILNEEPDWKELSRTLSILREKFRYLTIHHWERDNSFSSIKILDYKPDRLGHGIRALFYPDVLDKIIDNNITLEICPLSNLLYREALAGLETHPIADMVRLGIPITINSDGTMYGQTLHDNFLWVRNAFGFND